MSEPPDQREAIWEALYAAIQDAHGMEPEDYYESAADVAFGAVLPFLAAEREAGRREERERIRNGVKALHANQEVAERGSIGGGLSPWLHVRDVLALIDAEQAPAKGAKA